MVFNVDRLRVQFRGPKGAHYVQRISRAFLAGTAALLVDAHSEVKGQARESQRVLITFTVDDAVEEQKRLEGEGVRFVRLATREPWGGLVATFMDLDGNYCQLVDTVARVYI